MRSGKTKSCGCQQYKPQYNDLTGRRFGYLLVIARVNNKGVGHFAKSRWRCRCDCGNFVNVIGTNLVSGNSTSCGCKPKKKVNDISGQRFGMLVAKRYVGGKRKPSGQIASMWECECDCGKIVIVSYSHLVRFHTVSCGCMNISRGELVVSSFLTKQGIHFVSEYSFDDLLSEADAHLRFDFAVFLDSKVVGLIEVQGIQHFEPVEYFGGEAAFAVLQQNDKLKTSYCIKNSLPLLVLDFAHVDDAKNIAHLSVWLNSIFDEEII